MSSPSVVPTSFPGIYGNSSYLEYQFSIFTLPGLLLFPPILYMPITVIIILRIFVKLRFAVKDKNVNVPLFSAICISQFMCLLFFICDFVYIRLMTAGVFTRWCASTAPNGYIIILYVFTYYVNYATMLFPFLVSTMRIVLFVYPQNQAKINGTILRVALPLIAIYPSFSTFFMITAVGYCSQTRGPYPFGSVIIGFQGSLFGLRNGNFLLYNNLFWMSASIINNAILLVKLVHLKTSLSVHARSQKSHKSEVSLTLTTFSMIFSYLSNSMVVITSQLGGDLTYYAIMLRPFGNDLETCVVPWVFYKTHPCFLFFIADCYHLRLPATGVFTSWCASVEPNRFIMFFYIIDFYINYATMLFPILISLLRLVLIIFPQSHDKINKKILKSSIPIIFIYPLFFTFFMVPAVGFCVQAAYPFTFGAVTFHFEGTWFGLRNNYFLLYNNLFWMFICGVMNAVLLVKLIILKVSLSQHARSHYSYRTELSLTLTTISMFFYYLSNGMVVICAQLFPAFTYFAIMLRPFGNDFESCVVPWVFYLTHPVFRRSRRLSRTGNIVLNS